MYINPNSTIKLLKNVPLDNTYDHTIFFTSATQQYNYFNSFTQYTFDNQYYQRLNRGYLRIKRKADDLYNCNYLMFRNTAYGNKWFYAFISSVEYINDSVTEIQYEIDVMQTWYFDYTLGECFVEREHSATDVVGDNLVPEKLPTGEIMYEGIASDLINYDYQSSANDLHPCAVVAAPFNKSGQGSVGAVAGGMYSGLVYNVFVDQTNNSMIDQLIDFFQNAVTSVRASEIVTMFYYFKEFGVQPGSVDTPSRSYNLIVKSFSKAPVGFMNDYSSQTEVPYYPRNHKLYTSPYCFFSITDWTGNSIDYAYEYFSTLNCIFEMRGALSATPSIQIAPRNYMGYADAGYNPNYDYVFVYNDFPKIPWSTDGFIAWLAQTGVALAGKIAGDFIGSGYINALGSAAMHNSVVTSPEVWKAAQDRIILDTPASEALANGGKYPQYKPNLAPMPEYSSGISGSVGNVMAGGALAALKGRRIGGVATDLSNWSINKIRVSAVRKKIRKEWAIKIDKYFDMFGYATMSVKVPNRYVRERWTYTKTVGCVLATSNLPADDAKTICGIYDHGITFWVSTATVGDYSASNNPIA